MTSIKSPSSGIWRIACATVADVLGSITITPITAAAATAILTPDAFLFSRLFSIFASSIFRFIPLIASADISAFL